MTDIPTLGGGGGSKIPTVKLPNVGDYADLAIIDTEWVEVKDDKGAVKLKDNGQPQKQMRVTAIYKGGTAVTGTLREPQPANAGEMVTAYFGGQRAKAWVDASNEYQQTHGDLKVGTLIRWRFESTQPARSSMHHDLKVQSITLAPNEDQGLVNLCVQKYHERKAPPAVRLEQAAPRAEDDPFNQVNYQPSAPSTQPVNVGSGRNPWDV